MDIEEKIGSEIKYEIILHPEDDSPEGYFDTGDDEQDTEICNKIREDLEWNPWAWCIVEVKASWNELSASDYLGGCSYANEKDFREGGYFEDMKKQAKEELLAKIEKVQVEK